MLFRKEAQDCTNPAKKISLYDVVCNANYKLVSVPANALLSSMGIDDSFPVYKKYQYRFGGPVIIMSDHSEIAIGKDIAVQIQVSEV